MVRINPSRREQVDIANRLQTMGAIEGSIRWFCYSTAAVAFAHWKFPQVRRQTLAGKAFLISGFTVYGMVAWADHYLIQWETKNAAEEQAWRNVAQGEFSRKGLIPSEYDLQHWKSEWDRKVAQEIEAEKAGQGVQKASLGSVTEAVMKAGDTKAEAKLE